MLTTSTQRSERLEPANPWPMFHADLRHTGVGRGSRARGILKWAFRTGGRVRSSPAVSGDGVVYVGSENGFVYAVDSTTGEQRFAVPIPDAASSPGVEGPDGTVFVGTANGFLHAADSGTGDLRWSCKLGYGVVHPLLPGPGVMGYVRSGGRLYGVDTTAGHVRWTVPLGRRSSPLLLDDALYVGSRTHVRALDAITGEERWAFDTGTYRTPTGHTEPFAVVAIEAGPGNLVYATIAAWTLTGPQEHTLRAMDRETGAVRRTFVVAGRGWRGPILSGSLAIVGTGQALFALDAATGPLKWNFQAEGGMAPPAVTPDGRIYLGAREGVLYCLERSTGDQLWRIETGGEFRSGPTIVSDRAVVITNDGVQAFNSATGAIEWHVRESPLPQRRPLPGPDGSVVVLLENRSAALDAETGVERWSFPGRHFTIASSGAVYGAGFDGKLYRLNAINGSREWIFQPPGPVYSSPALGAGGALYVQGGVALHALDRQTGASRWTYRMGGAMKSSPAPCRYVYIGTWDDHVFALDAATGQRRWTLHEQDGFDTAPAVAPGGAVYVGGYSGALLSLDPESGEERWSADDVGRIDSSPALGADGTVYFGRWNNRVCALDGSTGAERWSFETGGPVHSSPAISPQGVVYVGSDDGKIYSLDGAEGTLRWSFQTEGPVGSSPAIDAAGTVYVGSDDGNLYALDGRTGSLLWSFATSGPVFSSPAVDSDGTIYVGSDDGCLYAIG
ncbi:MAG TPA: PQQ-binding-like beta-propeller repeat protein [Armatimonadota bacterium]|nr:PQQ-binding-like beta-propeller repeat protein [Armatimonadota bacterium]